MPPTPPPQMPESDEALLALTKQYNTHARMIRSRTRGKIGEIMASVIFSRDIRDSVVYDSKVFSTPFGLRRLDNYLEDHAEAVEAKMTYVVARRRILEQIRKDAYLLDNGLLRRMTWILYKGGSKKLKSILSSHGIIFIDGWDALIDVSKAEETSAVLTI